jgi:hypothetical protein
MGTHACNLSDAGVYLFYRGGQWESHENREIYWRDPPTMSLGTGRRYRDIGDFG